MEFTLHPNDMQMPVSSLLSCFKQTHFALVIGEKKVYQTRRQNMFSKFYYIYTNIIKFKLCYESDPI